MAPNYASSAVGKIIYSELVDSFSRVLAYYNTNDLEDSIEEKITKIATKIYGANGVDFSKEAMEKINNCNFVLYKY